jgi:hypothetical protein
LIWDPRELPIVGRWLGDGPFVPVEFARQSSNGRITLVITPGAVPVRVFWAQFAPMDLADACDALGGREGVPDGWREKYIGRWRVGDDPPDAIPGLAPWAQGRGVDAVVWTALPPRFDGQEQVPAVDEVIGYLEGLRGGTRDEAERYIRCAPAQTDTAYRRRIEVELGWRGRCA